MADWEQCKENIKPLRKGRNIKMLSEVLSVSHEWQSKREEYEYKLKMYTGDDPLEIWYEYIMWLEQIAPKVGEKDLILLINKCVLKFNVINKYFEDERLLEICLRYAEMSKSPLEALSFFYSNKMFSKLPKFYIKWADELEMIGNLKKADAIYREGLQLTGYNERLQQQYKLFQARFLKCISTNNDDLDASDEGEEAREAFHELPTLGKNKKAPFNRAALGDHNSVINKPQPMSTGKTKPSITIFEDNDCATALPSKECKVLSFDASAKENTLKPSQWNKGKFQRKKSQRLASTAVSHCKQNFTVYSDDDGSIPSQPGDKTKFTKVFQDHKDTHDFELTKNIQSAPQKYMCNLDKLYNGTVEWSLEELRAVKYQKGLLDAKSTNE